MINPGDTFQRAGVIVVVLRKRTDWGNMPNEKMPRGDWYDVLNLASDTEIEFHEPGRIVSLFEDLFEPTRCKRW